jgi:SAM-dependent methyltransferase
MVGVLEHLPDDRAMVAECHRVLKPGGRLVLAVRQTRPWTLLRPLRRLFGVADQVRGRARAGYGESGLFDVLKDGFDVEEAHPYSRFFTQLLDIPLQRAIQFPGIRHEMASGHVGDEERVLMAYRRAARSASFWYPAGRLASVVDLLLVGSRGHALAAAGRRRQWRPRRAPTLKDGRSIAEATINTKIGTAAPF